MPPGKLPAAPSSRVRNDKERIVARASLIAGAADRMTAIATESSTYLLRDSQDFSLVHGGPLFQLLLRSHLSSDGLTLVVPLLFPQAILDAALAIAEPALYLGAHLK